MLGQLTQFLNSIYFEYIPAVKDRQFLQYLFKKLQTSLFNRDVSFKEASNGINEQISRTTSELFHEFKEKTGVDATFSIPESLIDFFTTINVSTENGISLYSRGDGIQARFIPAILNEISKGKKYTIWGFEEPENSFEYSNAKLLASDFLDNYSIFKQIFITSHTKEFLSLIKENEDRVSLHRVYKTLGKGSLIESYKKGIGFNKKEIQYNFWAGANAREKNEINKNILNKIFDDIGFLESDQYLIEDLQNQLKMQRQLLDSSEIEVKKREKINTHLNRKLLSTLQSKEDLEKEIEEFKKPILYVEDKYDQIYKIAFLKSNNIECDIDNFEDRFNKDAFFTIRKSYGSSPLAGRLRTPSNDGYEDKKLIGLFDFDTEGKEQFLNLSSELWSKKIEGDLKSGYYKKRIDHPCFISLLLPIPDRLHNYANMEWEKFISYVEIENLLPDKFLKEKKMVDEKPLPGGTYLKIKSSKKATLWKLLFELSSESFCDFIPLFGRLKELFIN